MKLVFNDRDYNYFEQDGMFFMTHKGMEASLETVKKCIAEAQKSIAGMALTVFHITKQSSDRNNMSLYEYEALVKESKKVHPALKSAVLFQKYERVLYICCEPYDDDSPLTPENKKVIREYVKSHEAELLKTTGKEYIEWEWYLD